MAKKAALRPLGDRVVVKPVPRDEKTASGIILPDTAQEKPQEGEVVAVGPGRILEDGKREAIDVKVGDQTIFLIFNLYLSAALWLLDISDFKSGFPIMLWL